MDPKISLFAALVVVWLGIRQQQGRSLRPTSLCILPVLTLAATVNIINPSLLEDPFDVVVMSLALASGGVIGIIRGMLTRLQIDSATGRLVVQGSVTGFVLWLALIIARISLKYLMGDTNSSFYSGADLLGAVSIVMLLGSISGQRFCWFYRYFQMTRYSLR